MPKCFSIVSSDPGSRGPAYRFYVFLTKKDAKESKATDKYSIIYNSFDELKEMLTREEMEDIFMTCNLDLTIVPLEFDDHDRATKKLHHYIHNNSSVYREKLLQTISKIKNYPTGIKRSRYDRNLKINVISDSNLRSGTNRYRNQMAIIKSKTIGEALDRLKALPSPGNAKDIKMAIESGVVELVE